MFDPFDPKVRVFAFHENDVSGRRSALLRPLDTSRLTYEGIPSLQGHKEVSGCRILRVKFSANGEPIINAVLKHPGLNKTSTKVDRDVRGGKGAPSGQRGWEQNGPSAAAPPPSSTSSKRLKESLIRVDDGIPVAELQQCLDALRSSPDCYPMFDTDLKSRWSVTIVTNHYYPMKELSGLGKILVLNDKHLDFFPISPQMFTLQKMDVLCRTIESSM